MLFIPWIAASAGTVMIAWGTRMIIHNDDSADKVAQEFFSKLPSRIKRFVERVEITSNGIIIHWKKDLSQRDRKRFENEL